MVITRVRPMSAAKIQGLFGLIAGLLIGAMFSLIGLVAGSMVAATDEGGAGAFMGMLFGVGAIIVLPLFYGGMSFVMGAIAAVLYNLAAGWVGGLEVDTQ